MTAGTADGPRSLEGRTALLVGANGRIGNAIAHALGARGARLVLAGRDERALGGLAELLAADGVETTTVAVDVADAESVAGALSEAAGGGLDVAVNNVGTAHRPVPLGDLAVDELDRVLGVTLRGVALAMRQELRLMRDGGSIVNVASSAGTSAAPGMSAYVAAKHGVVGLTRTAALDYASRGIRVNAVVPGPIASGGLIAQPQDVQARVGAGTPLGRLGRPEEVAAAVAWLASPASSFTTGSLLTLDGGRGAG